MKNVVFLKGMLVVMLGLSISITSAQKQKIKGSGNVISQDRPVEDFSELLLDGLFNVYLSQGDAPSVKVEADDNLQTFIKVESKGGKLSITDENEENIKKYTKMAVYVTLRDIEKLSTDMVGNVFVKDTLNVSMLRLINDESTGLIDLKINVTKLMITSKGLGDLKLSGSAETVDIDHKGSGNINAFSLKAGDMVIDYSGVGNIDVNATNNLSYSSSGVGHIAYKGNPALGKSEVTGTGTVKKVK